MMKIHVLPLYLAPFMALLLASCATPVFNTEGIDLALTPKRAVVENASLQGKSVIWGGIIIAGTNLKDSTQFEILAYPIDPYQRPMSNEMAQGRFLAIQTGYLETTDFEQGRLITVQGTLGTVRSGRVGESDYTYPVVNIKQIHLWPKESEYVEPRVRFGIGVMIRN